MGRSAHGWRSKALPVRNPNPGYARQDLAPLVRTANPPSGDSSRSVHGARPEPPNSLRSRTAPARSKRLAVSLAQGPEATTLMLFRGPVFTNVPHRIRSEIDLRL